MRPLWLVRALVERIGMSRRLDAHDAVVFQRELVSTLPTVETWFRLPRILDVDDAIHLYRRGWAARSIASACAGVVCGNEYLADWYSKWTSNVAVVPTGVDVEAYQIAADPSRRGSDDLPVIGWIGSPGNLKYLADIAAPLERVCRSEGRARVEIITDGEAKIPDQWKHWADLVPWRPGIEYERIQSWRIGLMPLADGEWERGKCAFKILQYLAAGVPAIASPVGMNRTLLGEAEVGLPARTERDWYEAICGLLLDPTAAYRMGVVGRELVRRDYSVERVAELWRQILGKWL